MKKPLVAVAAPGATEDDRGTTDLNLRPSSSSRAAASRQHTAHPSSLPEPVEIAKFWRNRKHEAVLVSLREYGGRCILDARVHFEDKEGRLQPSKKGLSILVARLPELAAAITKALAKARELGLIDEADDG